MGTVDVTSFLWWVAVATTAIICVVIYSRKKRQVRNTAEEIQRKAAEKEQQCTVERKAALQGTEGDEQQPLGMAYPQPEEELQKKTDEENHKAKEENKRLEKESHREAKEPQLKSEKETRRNTEESQKVKDGYLGLEGSNKLGEEDRLKAETESKPLPVGKRGGRPRQTQAPEKKSAKEPRSRRSKPEIVCWKEGRQWIAAVEVSEDLLTNSDPEVFQNGSPLTRDENREDCWRLNQTCGQVVVRWNEDEVEVTLGERNYLLFKLGGQNQNQGRCVKSPSSGSYLVVAPDNWERDDELSGPPPAVPEPASLTGYKAHFFDLEKGGSGKIAFRTPGDEPVTIVSKASQFELIGRRLNDTSGNRGPLFGERPPQIRSQMTRRWEGVGIIVVGEEGGGRFRWRMCFSPEEGRDEQNLPPEVSTRKAGWYFLRFYDTNGDLLESLDFRFVSALKEIKMPQPVPLPSEGGHEPVHFEFLHERDCIVQLSGERTSIIVDREDNRTILTIPSDPTCDKTHWRVGPEDGPKVEVTVLAERLWWSIGEEDNPPSEWKDLPLSLTRNDFTPTSRKALWLRLPRQHWTDKITVGFTLETSKQYRVKITERTVAVPLRDFGDAQEIQDAGKFLLKAWVDFGGTPYPGVLGELVIKFHCRTCDFLAFTREDMIHHIESCHIQESFRPLTYNEMRDRNPELPRGIYRCAYCNVYVESDDFRNPTSMICRHIVQDCTGVPRGMQPIIRFRFITEVDEIRDNVFNHLPHVYRCNRCNFEIEESTPQANQRMRTHLIENHQAMLWELQ